MGKVRRKLRERPTDSSTKSLPVHVQLTPPKRTLQRRGSVVLSTPQDRKRAGDDSDDGLAKIRKLYGSRVQSPSPKKTPLSAMLDREETIDVDSSSDVEVATSIPKKGSSGRFVQSFDSFACKLVRDYEDGTRTEARMEPGPMGLALGVFDNEPPFETECPNVLLAKPAVQTSVRYRYSTKKPEAPSSSTDPAPAQKSGKKSKKIRNGIGIIPRRTMQLGRRRWRKGSPRKRPKMMHGQPRERKSVEGRDGGMISCLRIHSLALTCLLVFGLPSCDMHITGPIGVVLSKRRFGFASEHAKAYTCAHIHFPAWPAHNLTTPPPNDPQSIVPSIPDRGLFQYVQKAILDVFPPPPPFRPNYGKWSGLGTLAGVWPQSGPNPRPHRFCPWIGDLQIDSARNNFEPKCKWSSTFTPGRIVYVYGLIQKPPVPTPGRIVYVYIIDFSTETTCTHVL